MDQESCVLFVAVCGALILQLFLCEINSTSEMVLYIHSKNYPEKSKFQNKEKGITVKLL